MVFGMFIFVLYVTFLYVASYDCLVSDEVCIGMLLAKKAIEAVSVGTIGISPLNLLNKRELIL
jgi:hypothetical protein